MPRTGNGGVVTASPSGVALAFTKIGELQMTRGKLAVDHLGSVGFRPQIPDDHQDPGEIELEAWFDATEDLADIGEGQETITITYPLENEDWEVPATLSGTGFLIAVGTPECVNGQVSKQKLKIAFDGGTGPTFSPELEETPP